MARKTKKPPIERDSDRTDDFAPPDRPDQIAAGSERAEEIDIFANDDDRGQDRDRGDGDGDRELPGPRDDGDDGRAPEIESRENRERDPDDRPVQRRESRGSRRNGDRDDGEQYSQNVQRRINREIALRKRSDARLKEERIARQKLEERLQKLERTHVEAEGQASLREIDAKMKDVAAKLAAAKEANDTAREVELQVELGELQGQKVTLQAKIDREREQRANATNDADRDDGHDDNDRPTSRRSAEWVRAQRRWWSTVRWKDAQADAITHDSTILREIDDGELEFEPYSDEHFEELSRRLKADYPDLEIRTLDGERFEERDPDDEDDDDYRSERMGNRRDDDGDDDRRPSRRRGNDRRRAPMGGLGGREGRRERNEVEMARRGKVQLTDEDFSTMRVFKLDPSNPEHKKYFAREKARTLLRESNNGATRR